jgi:serine/threonine protein kinase
MDYPDFSQHNYRIIQELARNREGGRISYLAETIESIAENKQQVVIKQFRFLQHNTSWQGFKAYEREIEVLQSLNHPRIPQYLASFETPEGFCMVQEYKDAPSLVAKSHLSLEAISKLTVSTLEILVYLQSFIPAIVHRDIKPENILVDADYNAYLIDFGLSKVGGSDLAASSIVAGTPGFISPEELFNRPLTEATDLYSLGATLIGLLTNTRSTEISNLIDDNYRFKFQHHLRHINPRFIAWLTKMVEPNLKERFKDAKTALTDLQSIDSLENNLAIKTRKNTISSARKSIFAIGTVFVAIFIQTYCSHLIKYNKSLQTGVKNYYNPVVVDTPVYPSLSAEEEWFERIEPNCNSLEIASTIKSYPPPNTIEGYAYAVSCYALAGKIARADELIQELPEGDRLYVAQVLFNIAHPIADAGDDESAGPIMGLVLKYWTDNFMAMYHAGMSEYAIGDLPKSKQYLEQFLLTYQNKDIWQEKAIFILERIDRGLTIDSEPRLNPSSLSRH